MTTVSTETLHYYGTQRAGIAAGGIFYNVQPGTAAWLCLKVEDTILLLGVIRQAQTIADSDL